MKPTKYTLPAFLCIGATLFFSCKGSYTCKCNTAATAFQTYSIGNQTYNDAKGKCLALQHQYSWDTCWTIEEK